MKVCAHCQQPIHADEPYRVVVPDSMSGARPTQHYHRAPCQRPRTQSAPVAR